jgi:hypothetical protein
MTGYARATLLPAKTAQNIGKNYAFPEARGALVTTEGRVAAAGLPFF